MRSVNPFNPEQAKELARCVANMASLRMQIAQLSTSMVFNADVNETERARGILDETAQTLAVLEVGLVPDAGLRQWLPDCFDPEPTFSITQTEADMIGAYITVGFGAATGNANQLKEGLNLVRSFPDAHMAQMIAVAKRMYQWIFTSRGMEVPVPSKLAPVSDRTSRIIKGN